MGSNPAVPTNFENHTTTIKESVIFVHPSPAPQIEQLTTKQIESSMKKRDISIFIGNALDRFDISLYSFLAPIFAPLFFPQYDFVVQLILAYSVVALSFISDPLGVFVFGHLAQRRNPAFGLSFSLIGVAISTVLMGLLPGFDTLGIMAPLGLVFLRFFRAICASGETTISRLYIMEGKSEKKALTASYWYHSTTMIGIVFASFLSMLVLALNKLYPEMISYSWRICFIFGGITGLSGYFLRLHALREEKRKVSQSQANITSLNPVKNLGSLKNTLKQLWLYRYKLIQITTLSSLSYLTYTIPFIFMNSFIPMISDISYETMMSLNTALLIFDTFLIPVVGHYTTRYNPTKVLIFSSFVLSLTVIPLFHFLEGASFFYICFVRLWIVFWGVVFLCPLNYWYRQQFQGPEQYFLIGMGNAFGAATLGRMATPACLWLWHMGNLTFLPACYITLVSLLAFIAISTARKKTSQEKELGTEMVK